MRTVAVLALSLFGSVFLVQAASLDAPEATSGESSGTGPLLDNARRQKAPQPANELATSIRVNTDMTLVPVTVTDGFGRNVEGLEKQNFRVFEDAEQRSIVSFGREDAPVSVGLIFDSSGTVENQTLRSPFRVLRDSLRAQLAPDTPRIAIRV
jgi:hypothetical protein